MTQARTNKRKQWRCTQSLANRICDGLAAGKTLTALCRSNDLPPASTVLRWVKDAVPIEYDGSENPEELTAIDRALLEHRAHLDATLHPAAKDKPNEKAPTVAQGDNEQGDKVDTQSSRGVGVTLLFNEYYAHARVLGYELLADHIRDIADDDSRDTIDGKANHAATQRDRLRADVYRWMLARMLPKVYSDQGVRLTVQGNDAGNAPDVILTGNDVDL